MIDGTLMLDEILCDEYDELLMLDEIFYDGYEMKINSYWLKFLCLTF